MIEIETLFRESVEASLAVKRRVLETALPAVARAADLLLTAYRAHNKAIFFGNGGSASDAQHLAAEMEGRFGFDRRPLPALALHANVSTLTAIANDYSYEQVFARLLTAHARPGDVAVAISTSGTSRNVVAAAKLKRELGITLVALTGENGAALAPYADALVSVPSTDTARIQEAHIMIGHILCDYLERSLFVPPPR
jgi:D-sedoheptulose 7-phosphate isomerase